MDHIRSCYSSYMRLYTDRPDVVTKGQWHFCPEGAVNLPGPHLFTSSRWDNEPGFDPDIGEQASLPRRWFNGSGDDRLLGTNVCGFKFMEIGSLYEQRGTPQTDGHGLPLCCNRKPVPRTGDADGGMALQGWGLIQVAQGGDSDGGGEYRRAGDADDGTALQDSDYLELAGGGDSDDGTAFQASAYDEIGGGGDSDDGTALQSRTDVEVGGGGDSDDGSALQSRTDLEVGAGGDSDDGEATQDTTVPSDVPIGGIFLWPGMTPPANAVPCDGSSYATTGTYANLFAVIGYNYGGSGANFNVPDFRGRMPVGIGGSGALPNVPIGGTGGEKDHTLTTAEMPAHTHSVAIGTGATSGINPGGTLAAPGTSGSTGGGGSHNNMPPYIGVDWMIQYA